MKKTKKNHIIQKSQLIQPEKEMKRKRKIIEKNNQNNANVSSTSINSQLFLYKKNINELIDNDDINK